MTRKVIFILLLLLATPVFAVTIGQLQPGGGTVASRGGTLAPITIYSLARPALDNGSVDRATVVWTAAPEAGCEDAFKIKIFRPGDNGGIQVVAERGPFDVQNGINTVSLSPAVSVLAGDIIGVTQLRPMSCGGVVNRRSDKNEVWGASPNDPSSGNVTDIEYEFGVVPSVRATGESQPVHGYLPVVGSTRGSFGSLFKTAIQLTNRGNSTITGRLVFHPQGAAGTTTDPSFSYVMGPQDTLSIDDIVLAAGATGIGSMDVVPLSHTYPPDISARIYNDAGSAGTSGFTLEMMTAYQALHRFDRGSFQLPADLTNFRVNVGVLTLGSGADISVIQYDADGELTEPSSTRTYEANRFEQVTASQFLADGELAPGGYMSVVVTRGSAFIYATVTDNRTNDSSIRFVSKY